MKILVVSDSHGNLAIMDAVVNKIKNKISMVIHLGDCYSDAEALKNKYSGLLTIGVAGNCDFSKSNSEHLLHTHNQTIYMTHGHMFHVKRDLAAFTQYAKEKKADAALFGHTHSPYLDYTNGIVLLNPGSIAYPRGWYDVPSYGVLDIAEGKIRASIVGVYGESNYQVLDALSI